MGWETVLRYSSLRPRPTGMGSFSRLIVQALEFFGKEVYICSCCSPLAATDSCSFTLSGSLSFLFVRKDSRISSTILFRLIEGKRLACRRMCRYSCKVSMVWYPFKLSKSTPRDKEGEPAEAETRPASRLDCCTDGAFNMN